jgi:hypothetical protein
LFQFVPSPWFFTLLRILFTAGNLQEYKRVSADGLWEEVVLLRANAQHINRQRLHRLAPLHSTVLGYEARYTEVEGGVNLNAANCLCGVNLIEKSSWTYTEAELGAGA